MTPQEFATVREIFHKGCELPRASREVFIDQSCSGNPSLRDAVEALFLADEAAESAGDSAASEVAGRLLSATLTEATMPREIGPYRILSVLGRGGMGVAYLAQQSNPDRQVALKVLRSGVRSTGIRVRFAREIRALGRLAHPGIASIFESGTAECGHEPVSYYAMEYVAGPNILDYAREQTLDLSTRLELVARVADAVQHAHTKGVVHRDLKPANILVRGVAPDKEASGHGSTSTGLLTAGPHPVILDFGIARILDGDEDATRLTEAGLLIGTVGYMSVEQLSGDIDARADVYSMGVILYELLTGRMPHDLRGKPVPEAARIVRDEDPAPLNSRDNTVPGFYDRDIVTIVGRAIAKNREDRYQTAASLAEDIRRYLNHEPILARPATTLYHMSKFARRHRGLVAGAVSAVLMLAAGLGASLAFSAKAEVQKRHAEEERRIAIEQRERADRTEKMSGGYTSALTFSNAANVFTGNGADLTALDASNISTGTLADARLSPNVVVRNAPNAFGDFTNSFAGNVGIGTPNPVYPINFSNTIGDKISLFGTAADHFGFGIQPNQLQIHTNNSTSDIVFGYGNSSALTETMRIQGDGRVGIGTSAPDNTMLHALTATRLSSGTFETDLAGGVGVWGIANGTTLDTVAGAFVSQSNAGTGVYAIAESNTGVTYGVRAYTDSNATNAVGVFGQALRSGANFGVYGQAAGASSFGVYANGRLGASGTKSFMIDHPLDPENKFLMHYSMESPEVLNVYSGTAPLGSLVSPDGTLRMKATEMRGVSDATEGYTKNWDQVYNLGSGANLSLEGKACVSDLRGNLFTGGRRGNGQYHLAQLSGATGERLNDQDFTVASGATGATVYSTALDPEGILYVAGAYSQGANLRCFVARHNPDATLSRTWIKTDTLIASTALRVVTDRRGAVYFMYTTSDEIVKVTKLSPYDGIADWTWSGAPGSSGAALELDAAGNPHVAVYTGSATNDWNTVKLDTATGAALWTRTVTNGRPVDLKIDTKGNVFVLGSKGTATARIEQYTASGASVAGYVTPFFGTTGEPYKLALDWIGNPYAAITYGTTRMSTDVRKFNPVTGEEVWQYQRSPVYNSAEVNGNVEIIDLVIDASGSLFLCGNRDALSAISGSYLSHEFFFIKYEQAYVSIPQIARSYPVTRIEGNSIWSPANPDLGGVTTGWANQDRNIFTVNVSSIMNTLNSLPGGGLDGLTQREVNYGVGTAAGGLDINVNNGQFNVFFRSSVSGGSYDATVSGELAIAIPGEDEINVGQPVNITINFDPDATGMELITNGRPEIDAGIYARIKANTSARLFGRDSVLEAFGAPNPFFDLFVGQRNFDYTQQLVGLDLLPIPPGGTWIDLGDFLPPPYGEFVGGSARFPNLGTQGSYTDGSAGMTLSSSLSETFLEADVSVTNLVSTLAIGTPLSFGYGTPVGNNDFDASVEVAILQAYLEGSINLEQDLDLVMRPYVDLLYDSTGNTTRVYLNRVVDTNGNYSYQASANTPNLPAGGFTITPTFGVRASLQNRTGFRFGAVAGFAPLQLNAALEIVGVDIIDLDLAPGALEQDLLSPTLVDGVSNQLNSGRLTLLDTTSSEFDFANDVVCAPIVVASTAANNFPQLIGCSRETARMIIYEQRTPTQSELNALAVGTEPMVLYGRKFFTGVGGNTVRIKHCGRTEVLDSTRLNEQALLVQVPKRFFLLPGVARLWVTNNNGKSETIEFTIEHPMPNFQGLAEPIWAGDPRWINEGVVAIDGGTPLGNDSFIARRDYYTLLRTTLWNSTLAGSAISATSYFPEFKPWDTNPNVPCPPGFPALVVNGVALERKRPFVNDGFFRSKMQQGVYASPGFLDMELVNPGPGGGPSRTVTMEVPAPRPVISALAPAEVDPGSVAAGSELRIVVNGPESVPFFPGYERPKYGNFSPGSVVRLDGDPLRTEFVSSGRLVAYIPAASLRKQQLSAPACAS